MRVMCAHSMMMRRKRNVSGKSPRLRILRDGGRNEASTDAAHAWGFRRTRIADWRLAHPLAWGGARLVVRSRLAYHHGRIASRGPSGATE